MTADPYAFIPTVPKKPADCKRHRWSQRMNLRTGEMLDGAACWHCGTPESTSKSAVGPAQGEPE